MCLTGPFKNVICHQIYLHEASVCEWLLGRARLPTTHTLVKLTLCNGCYLIIENGRGRNQVSLWWTGGRRRTGRRRRRGAVWRLLQPVCSAPTGWGSCCVVLICPLYVKLVGSGAELLLTEGRRQGGSRNCDRWTETENSATYRNPDRKRKDGDGTAKSSRSSPLRRHSSLIKFHLYSVIITDEVFISCRCVLSGVR